MRLLDENSSPSEAFLRESLKLAGEALIEAEAKHKALVYSLKEKNQQESEKLMIEIDIKKEALKEHQRQFAQSEEQHKLMREALLNEISALRQSWSWRFTKPIRVVHAFFFVRSASGPGQRSSSLRF